MVVYQIYGKLTPDVYICVSVVFSSRNCPLFQIQLIQLNVGMRVTWDHDGDLKQLSMDQNRSEDNGND